MLHEYIYIPRRITVKNCSILSLADQTPKIPSMYLVCSSPHHAVLQGIDIFRLRPVLPISGYHSLSHLLPVYQKTNLINPWYLCSEPELPCPS